MSLSEDLQWRDLVKDKTFADKSWLDKPKSFYLGIDASSDSLTIGNLAILILARRLIEAGWQGVLLMGGGTTLIGDPGGKTEERKLISREDVKNNIERVKIQATQLFAGAEYTMVDNHDWLAELKYLDVLRDVGKHFSMTELMQREFVSERMGEQGAGISYAEFSYSLIQGYDFWHLFKAHSVVLQIGGSDQWGNMLSGVALIRKKEAKTGHAFSMPLIVNKETGQKFGKSEAGAIWLDPKRTSPTKFYQFWVNTDDADVENYLKVFTFLTKAEIDSLMAEQKAKPEARPAQLALAKELVSMVHKDSDVSVVEVTAHLTGRKPIAEADHQTLEAIRAEVPAVKSRPGQSIVDVLVASGLAVSKSEARRLLASNAVYINNETVDRELLAAADFIHGRALLRRGKAYKDSALIEQE